MSSAIVCSDWPIDQSSAFRPVSGMKLNMLSIRRRFLAPEQSGSRNVWQTDKFLVQVDWEQKKGAWNRPVCHHFELNLNWHDFVFEELTNGEAVMHHSRHRLTAPIACMTKCMYTSANDQWESVQLHRSVCTFTLLIWQHTKSSLLWIITMQTAFICTLTKFTYK